MTVLEKMLSRCEEAFHAKTPILFINTAEIEMIRALVESDRLVVRLARTGGKGESRLVPYREINSGPVENYKEGIPAASLDREWKESVPQIRVASIPATPTELMFTGLIQYIECYIKDDDDNSALRSSAIILYGAVNSLPAGILPYTEVIDVDLPDEAEISALISEWMSLYQSEPFEDARDLDDLRTALAGFSCVQIRNLLRRILSADDLEGRDIIRDMDRVLMIVRSAKEQILKRGQVLELVRTNADQDEIGGMDLFLDWLGRQKEGVLRSAKLRSGFGIESPKGVLVCGVPGCGKSLAAQALGVKLGVPLLKMDVGSLMGRYQGESEHNMILALKLTEAMSPCVLWIDEMDKGFSAAQSSGDGDSGSFKRMFGSLLTWMQDNDKPCFIFATSNSIAGMPKEFLRSGRFDELFAMYMPTFHECVDILQKRMKKAASKVKDRNLFAEDCYEDKVLQKILETLCSKGLDGKTRGRFVTGADIQKIVNVSLTRLYGKLEGRPEEITADMWTHVVGETLKEITVYGDGAENLDSIALCYIRLLRNNFRASALKSLFDQSEYGVNYGPNNEISVTLTHKGDKEKNAWPLYDRVMYDTLRVRIEMLASAVESRERHRLIQ